MLQTTMGGYELNFIDRALLSNRAYTVDVTGFGTFVVMDSDQWTPRYTPIAHEGVTRYLRNAKDFVIWIPDAGDEYRIDAPWGTGRPSANLYVCCIYA